ncbi:MAG: protein kinase [Planctomycetaceae bacterium]
MTDAPDPQSNDELDELIAKWMEMVEQNPDADREAFIAAHPDYAAGLRRHFENEDRFNAATVRQQQPGEPRDDAEIRRLTGTVIAGRYKLLEFIADGGMGTVWVAEQQEPVKRRVAVKLIKAGMDSKQVIARFEAERQALALMDHPNIARILDGGVTEQGRPFFVMEYVKGVPFTQYCDKGDCR